MHACKLVQQLEVMLLAQNAVGTLQAQAAICVTCSFLLTDTRMCSECHVTLIAQQGGRYTDATA